MYIHALVTIVLERAWAALKCDQLPVLYPTCMMVSSADLACYWYCLLKIWVYGDCGTRDVVHVVCLIGVSTIIVIVL